MENKTEQIIRLAKKNGITIEGESLHINESGLDFQVAFAKDQNGEQWVLRLPRRKDVIPSIQKEKKILTLAASQVHVEVPEWKVCTDELIAYKRLTGKPAGTVDHEIQNYVWEIDLENIPEVFHQTLGEALVPLHRTKGETVARHGLIVIKADKLRETMKTRMEKVKAEFGVSRELWSRWQTWIDNEALWPKQEAFIHGDLHAGHILIGKDTRVTGFIDWTEAYAGDPAVDFVAHYRTFGQEALDKLIHHYQKAGGYVWPQMAEHVIELTAAYPVELAEFAIRSGSEEYLEMTRQVLGVSEEK
ncbi:macrolide 2'-phosphotransferase [Bacillus sp. H-16]|uniref:macrolide 2'-phosphotransferase n=1 Tax=Alteribacter salitolerans TaxID=2912333 RepID=UPI00196361AB|nr:macrolide 2'-phosphotransferase [Alteribacter salitolerans]MBM7097986.1 macrolide 2'-phosphotransferase [Alteribacter salitolerans]